MLAETCIASAAFVDSLQEKALAEARSAAEEASKQRKASQAGASTPSEGDHAPRPFSIRVTSSTRANMGRRGHLCMSRKEVRSLTAFHFWNPSPCR